MVAVSVWVAVACAAAACGRSSTRAVETHGAPDAAPKAARVRVVPPGDAPADLEKSRVTLAVIKDKDVAAPVVARLALRDGSVSLGAPGGSARLLVDIDTFDSAMPIRNERVRNIFFESTGLGWDVAEVVVPSIGAGVLTTLKEKRRLEGATLEGTLKVHGKTVKVTMVVDASYGDDGRLTVKTAKPAEVRISELGLTDNLHRLSSICMHDSIDDVVKVEAAVEFAPPAGR